MPPQAVSSPVGCCRPSGADDALGNLFPPCPFAPLQAGENWAVRPRQGSAGRVGGNPGLMSSPWPVRAERRVLGQSHMREDTELWGRRASQRGTDATLLSHGTRAGKTGDSPWPLFAASIRGVDVSWQVAGAVRTATKCCRHLPARPPCRQPPAACGPPGRARGSPAAAAFRREPLGWEVVLGARVLLHKQRHEARPLSRGPWLAAGLCGEERG